MYQSRPKSQWTILYKDDSLHVFRGGSLDKDIPILEKWGGVLTTPFYTLPILKTLELDWIFSMEVQNNILPVGSIVAAAQATHNVREEEPRNTSPPPR